MTTSTIKHTTKTGTEVVAFCTKCKMALAHIIVAMDGEKIKRVRCNTCGSEHRFLTTAPKPKLDRAIPKSEANWEHLMQSSSSKNKIAYSPSGRYKENNLIDHPYFGPGIVAEVIHGKKIRVIFKEGEKHLAAGRESL